MKIRRTAVPFGVGTLLPLAEMMDGRRPLGPAQMSIECGTRDGSRCR